MPGVPQPAPLAGTDPARPSHPGGHSSGDYSRARVAEDDHAHRVLAARTVACNARSVQDLGLLLSILGLDAADRHAERECGPHDLAAHWTPHDTGRSMTWAGAPPPARWPLALAAWPGLTSGTEAC